LGELATFAQSKGVLELDDEFKRVSEAAQEVGRPMHRLKLMKGID
jgi:hypothetical protein